MTRKALTFNHTTLNNEEIPTTETLESGVGVTSASSQNLTLHGDAGSVIIPLTDTLRVGGLSTGIAINSTSFERTNSGTVDLFTTGNTIQVDLGSHNGVLNLDGTDILPVVDNFTSIGSPTKRFQTVHISQLYLRNDNTGTLLSLLGANSWEFSSNLVFSDGGSGLPVLELTSGQITIQDGQTLGCVDSGNINLPNNASARFNVEGVAVSDTVTAANLNLLTTGGSADGIHSHSYSIATYTSGEAITVTRAVAMENSGGSARLFLADATAAGNRHNCIGFAATTVFGGGVSTTVRISGETILLDSTWDTVPSVTDVGANVYVHTVAGQVSLTAPNIVGQFEQKVGTLVAAGGGVNTSKIVIQIGLAA